MMKQRIGVHIRLQSSLTQLIEKAQLLDLSFFQCFLVTQEMGKLITTTRHEEEHFLKIRRAYFKDLFCHGSYWINLASLGNNGYRSLCNEVALAKRLEFTHFVLHPGTAKGAREKSQGIDALAFCLNNMLKREKHIAFLLENTCHSNLAIGSDILDFKYLLEKIDYPERIGFCIDTAHAHSYGYDIIDEQAQNDFIALLDNLIGIERIKLIHLNDSHEQMGSYKDRHAVIGEGKIGLRSLMSFALHPQLAHIPLLLELPDIPLEREQLVIENLCKEYESSALYMRR